MMSVTAGAAGPSVASGAGVGVGLGVGVGGGGTGVGVGTIRASVGWGRGVLNSTVAVGVSSPGGTVSGEGPQPIARTRSKKSEANSIRFMSLVLLCR